MGAHDSRIDHRVFVVGLAGQMLEDLLPDPASGPSAETRMHHSEIAEPLRKIESRYPRSITVEHSFDKQSVVHSWSTHRPSPTWQHILHPIPLIVPQTITPY